MILVSQGVMTTFEESARVAFTPRQAVGTKADAVYDELREQLIAGKRRWGETLSTAELAEEFGVSRRPVMDAMMRLELAGFIEIIRQVGCRVVVPDRHTVRDHFYTAGVLEGAAARLAATKATAAERRALRALLKESAAASAANDVAGFQRANKRLHAAIQAAARNGRLAGLAHGAWMLSDFYLQARTPDDLRRSHREHKAIVDAIVRKDADAARDLMEQHMGRFGEEAQVPDGRVGR
jgi:DNA-binding GntR family transcriptional regulator